MGKTPAFDLEKYLAGHELSSDARDYIRDAARGLSRDVGQSGFPCVVTEYQSRKMQCTVYTESRSAEKALVIHLEIDRSVSAFFEQPPAVECLRSTKRGRRLTQYHPDFLALYDTGPVVLEAKTEERLVAKLQSHPQDWMRLDGRVVDLAATAAFEAIGLRHRVVSSAELCRYKTANYRLLIQARAICPASPELLPRVSKAFRAKCVMTLSELGVALGISDHSPLCSLIADGHLHADLSRNLLAEPEYCYVALDPRLLENLAQYLPDLWGSGPTMVGHKTPAQLVPSGKQAARGVEILETLRSGTAAKRSAARYRSMIEEGAVNGLTEFQSVVPRNDRSGNHTFKRPEIVLAYAENSLRDNWLTNKFARLGGALAEYKVDAAEWHPAYQPVTYKTFRGIADSLRPEAADGRGGLRAVNAASCPSPVESRALGPTRPFELATCDHALAKIFIIVLCANGWIYVQRPWITVLRDCCTKLVLAVWVSFKSPSKFACAMVLRACLRRHGRLPEGIVSDGGPEFRSAYYSAFLAHCGVDLVRRPSGHPRYGSEAERYYGHFNEEWLASRPGNLVNHRNLRVVSGSHKPERFAQIDALAFVQEMLAFNAVLNQAVGPHAIQSPEMQNELGLRRFGCSGHVIPYDRSFVIASAIDVGEFKLDPARGLHIDESHYWHPVLQDPSLLRRDIIARREPEDASIVYINARGNWYTAESGRAPRLRTLRPIDRVVDRLLTVDASAARDLAGDDKKTALVRARRVADANLPPMLGLADSSHAPPPRQLGLDLFDVARETALVTPDQMRWVP